MGDETQSTGLELLCSKYKRCLKRLHPCAPTDLWTETAANLWGFSQHCFHSCTTSPRFFKLFPPFFHFRLTPDPGDPQIFRLLKRHSFKGFADILCLKWLKVSVVSVQCVLSDSFFDGWCSLRQVCFRIVMLEPCALWHTDLLCCVFLWDLRQTCVWAVSLKQQTWC